MSGRSTTAKNKEKLRKKAKYRQERKNRLRRRLEKGGKRVIQDNV